MKVNIEIRGSAKARMAVTLPVRPPTRPRRAARRRCQPKTVRRKTRSTARVSPASKASW
jgi:hypothetical protein